MKFKILVKDSSGKEWWEDYDKHISDPQAWAEETIIWFNDTLRPYELPRELLEVKRLKDE